MKTLKEHSLECKEIFVLATMKLMNRSRAMALDLTHALSMSEGIISATLGQNSTSEFLTHVQLVLLFSSDHDTPAYFKVVPGTINSVMSSRITVEESCASHLSWWQINASILLPI